MDPRARILLSLLVREGVPVIKEYALTSVRETSERKRIELSKELIDKQLLVLKQEGGEVAPLQAPPRPQLAPSPKMVAQPSPTVKPLGPKEIDGRATWQILHTRARYFPVEPTQDEQDNIRDFIEATVTTLSCPKCAMHGRLYIEEHPIDVSSRAALNAWLCTFHNAVNERIGKPLHPCAVS